MNLTLPLHDAAKKRLALVWIAVAVLSVAGAAVAPIATFVLMISAFGLPHVLYELRYVDERFSARTQRGALAIIGLLVGVIAAARIGNGAHAIPSGVFVPLELGLGATLAFTGAYFMGANRALGAAIGLVFAVGATVAPIATFLIWAWIHNLTPLGFVAEITEGEERRRWLMLLAVPFFVLPALVATGVFHQAAALALGNAWWTTSAFDAGDRPLASFLAPGSSDLNLFAAAVVAQSMHYVAVIVLLPQLLAEKQPARAKTIAPWPSWPMFAAGVAAIAAIAFGVYWVSYSDARAAYGVAAAIHAWIELPVLLMAVGGGFRKREKRMEN